MYQKGLFSLSISILMVLSLVSCNKTVVDPKPTKGKVVIVEGVLILSQDVVGNQYLIGDDSTLDCNGHTLEASRENGRTNNAVELSGNNASIVNCIIDGYITGIRVGSKIKTREILRLKGLDKQGALAHIAQLQQRATRNKLIANNLFKNIVQTPVYVQMFAEGTVITNNSFIDAGRMAIYLDTYSSNSTITKNTIQGSGYNHVSGREGIAIDASSDNFIANNRFSESKLAAITLYKNCGERGLPRYFGANNNTIVSNHFYDESKGVWIASRADRDRFPDCIDSPIYGNVARDIAQYNIVSNNRYVRTAVAVDIRDNNNIITDNALNDAVIVEGSVTRKTVGDPVADNNISDNY